MIIRISLDEVEINRVHEYCELLKVKRLIDWWGDLRAFWYACHHMEMRRGAKPMPSFQWNISAPMTWYERRDTTWQDVIKDIRFVLEVRWNKLWRKLKNISMNIPLL